MKIKMPAVFAVFFLCIMAAPAAFAKSGQPAVRTKAGITLPLQKGRAAAIGVNRNYSDAVSFGNELYRQMQAYAPSAKLIQQEFIKRDEVSDCQYVWTFEIKKWNDKDSDGLPESIKAAVYVYDSSFNLLASSKISFNKKRKMESSNYLEPLIETYLRSIFEEQTEPNG